MRIQFFRGGLLPGDIVTHINDKQVKSANDIYELLKDYKSVKLKMYVSRFGQKITLEVTPEEALSE